MQAMAGGSPQAGGMWARPTAPPGAPQGIAQNFGPTTRDSMARGMTNPLLQGIMAQVRGAGGYHGGYALGPDLNPRRGR
jgi:hypothetical protein